MFKTIGRVYARISDRLSTRIGRLVLISTLVISFFLIGFIGAASHLAVKPTVMHSADYPGITPVINFAFEIISADPIARTFVIDWYPEPVNGCNPNLTWVADIYVDPGSVDITSPAFSFRDPYPPNFVLNTTSYCQNPTSTFPLFKTVSQLRALESDPIRGVPLPTSTLQNYPFDVYFAPQFLYALDHNTGATIPVSIVRSFGIAVNFEVSVVANYIYFPDNHVVEPRLYIHLKVERSKATKIFVVLIAITNWLIATAFLMICASTMVYHTPNVYAEMFVVPVGAVLSLTSVRANLPGAPVGFGAAIDSYSILPVLVIMALCSFYLLMTVLYRRLQYSEGQMSNWRSEPPKAPLFNTSVPIQIPMLKVSEAGPSEVSSSIDIPSTMNEKNVGGNAV